MVRPVRGDLGRVRGRLSPLAAARALIHRQLGLQEVHAEDGCDLGAPGRQGSKTTKMGMTWARPGVKSGTTRACFSLPPWCWLAIALPTKKGCPRLDHCARPAKGRSQGGLCVQALQQDLATRPAYQRSGNEVSTAALLCAGVPPQHPSKRSFPVQTALMTSRHASLPACLLAARLLAASCPKKNV